MKTTTPNPYKKLETSGGFSSASATTKVMKSAGAGGSGVVCCSTIGRDISKTFAKSTPPRKRLKTFGGFQSAKEMMNSVNVDGAAAISDGDAVKQEVKKTAANENNCSVKDVSQKEFHVEFLALLAPLLDECSVALKNVAVKEQSHSTLIVSATAQILREKDGIRTIIGSMLADQTGITSSFDTITAEVAEELSFGIAAQDLKTASCPVDFSQVKSLAWKTQDDGKSVSWPPSNKVMAQFGFGNVDDKEWWGNNGMNIPMEWNVSGALDILPHVALSNHQKQLAQNTLDDALHGITNIWSDDTLKDIGSLMHSNNFWSHRGADAFIKAFGGPYVLGQQEGKLKLIKGSPHTALTEKLCRGHNIVYTLIHSEPPGHGFNTLIFGLNLRRSGFHYHQDAIGGLKAKDAPMLPRQPVVTTVYYEKPKEDERKEIVLWKPLMNFKPKDDSVYMAARGMLTCHGMVHVQKAGLQSKAQHGIFRTPLCNRGDGQQVLDARVGYRVAITARITYDNSEERLAPFLKADHYYVSIGPEGNKTLSLK